MKVGSYIYVIGVLLVVTLVGCTALYIWWAAMQVYGYLK
jgi:hypothetical protein